MEVTHNDDQVTHAVIGGGTKTDFKIEDNGFFMHMLSASLYKDQRMAVAREVLCNADDAHKENNVTVPFDVTLTAEKLIIRDYGPGIPDDLIGQVYGTYGGSTKRNSTKATGGFGLGCKSPFAYTDNFQVTSFCNGVKTIYRMSKSDSEVGGKPSIIKILSVPTTETGLEVNINIAERRDVDSFAERIKIVLANGEMNANFNGTRAKVLPFSLMENGYLITDHMPLLEPATLMVRYGAVLYPIGFHEDYAHLYHETKRRVDAIAGEPETMCAILQAPPGSLSLTPSRESLTLTPQTIETVTQLLADFRKGWEEEASTDRVKVYYAAIQKMADNQNIKSLLASPGSTGNYHEFLNKVSKEHGHHYINNRQSLATWQVAKEYPGKRNHAFIIKDIYTRAKHLVKIHNPSAPYDRGLMRGYVKALKAGGTRTAAIKARDNFLKRVIAPVWVAMKTNPKYLHKQNLHVLENRNGWYESSDSYYGRYPQIYSTRNYAAQRYDSYFEMCHRTIVLTHNAHECADKLRWNGDTFGISSRSNLTGLLVLETGRAKAKVDAARELLAVLQAKGYKIIDLTLSVEYRPPRERNINKDKPKLTGFATLLGVQQPDGIFDWNKITKTELRVEKPEAYTMLYGKSSHISSKRILGYNAEEAKLIADMYGDVITPVMTSVQAESMVKNGVKSVDDWLGGKIHDDLVKDKELLRALPGTWRVLRVWAMKQSDLPMALLKTVVSNPVIAAALKVPVLVELDTPQQQLYNMFNTFHNQFDDNVLSGTEIGKAILNMEPSKKLKAFAKKLEGNPMLKLVNTGEVNAVFGGDDEVLKEKTLKLIKQILKG